MTKKIIAIVLVLVVALTALCGCGPTQEQLEKKYDEAGYICVSASKDTLSKYGIDSGDVSYCFVATKIVSNVVVVAFSSFSSMQNYIKENDLQKGEYKQSGSVLAFGDEEALKLF